jgi:zinc transport system permease protein
MIDFATFIQFAFVQKALLAGGLLAVVASILGVFVVLRRMSFFSDAVAHASLSGVAIGLLLQLDPAIGAICVSVLVGLGMGALMKKQTISSDTIIGVLFSSSMALAIFIISLLPGTQVDITSLLFGNILLIETIDLYFAGALLLATLLFIRYATKPMLKYTFDEDIALIEHKKMQLIQYIFLALLAMTIAVSLKIVGAVLVSALIIIPAASAQNVSTDLRSMVLYALCFALLSVFAGMYLSFVFDSPSGSTIVLSATAIFLTSLVFRRTS